MDVVPAHFVAVVVHIAAVGVVAAEPVLTGTPPTAEAANIFEIATTVTARQGRKSISVFARISTA